MDNPFIRDNFNLNEIDKVLYDIEHVQNHKNDFLKSREQSIAEESWKSQFHLNFSKDDIRIFNGSRRHSKNTFIEEELPSINESNSLAHKDNFSFLNEIDPPVFVHRQSDLFCHNQNHSMAIESDFEYKENAINKINTSFFHKQPDINSNWIEEEPDKERVIHSDTEIKRKIVDHTKPEKQSITVRDKEGKKIYSKEEILDLFKKLDIHLTDELLINTIDNDMIDSMFKKLKQIRLRNIKKLFSVSKVKSKKEGDKMKRRYLKVETMDKSSHLKKRIRKLKKYIHKADEQDKNKINLDKSFESSRYSRGSSFAKSHKEKKNPKTVAEILSILFESRDYSKDILLNIEKCKREKLIGLLKPKFVINEQCIIEGVKKDKNRNENHFKLIIKRALKYLIKEWKNQIKKRNKKDKVTNEINFYKDRFEETSNKLNLPIYHFYLPGSKIQNQIETEDKLDKTVNYAYLNRILNSETFRISFIDYLLYEFSKEYALFRKEKLSKLAEVINDPEDNNKALKLPWTYNEVLVAQKTMMNAIHEFK